MSAVTYIAVLMSACLACVGHGRKVPLLAGQMLGAQVVRDPLRTFATLLLAFDPSVAFCPCGPGARWIACDAVLDDRNFMKLGRCNGFQHSVPDVSMSDVMSGATGHRLDLRHDGIGTRHICSPITSLNSSNPLSELFAHAGAGLLQKSAHAFRSAFLDPGQLHRLNFSNIYEKWQRMMVAIFKPLRHVLRWQILAMRCLGQPFWVLMVALLLAPPIALAAPHTAAATASPMWTIPLVAGLINWATNRLAVIMMFYPIEFCGFYRRRIGWQGIVPGKAQVMANKIVDDVVKRLIDLKIIFARLQPDVIAEKLAPVVQKVAQKVGAEALRRRGFDAGIANYVISSDSFKNQVAERGQALVAGFVRDVQAEPQAVFDIRGVVVRGLASDPRVLVDLFERVGEKDLRFVVNSGLYLGGALGVLQMLLFMVWEPWWSLALTGALVGMVTDQIALKLIFEPIEPKRVGPFTFQGLFLRRQAQVSEQFCSYVAENVLTARQLWEELLSGDRCASFWRLLELRVDTLLGKSPDGGVPNIIGQGILNIYGQADLEWLRQRIVEEFRAELPEAIQVLYDLTEEELDLKNTMVEKMEKLSSAEFERVLHPVFEEDEWTLILVGTALGGIAGAAQAFVGI